MNRNVTICTTELVQEAKLTPTRENLPRHYGLRQGHWGQLTWRETDGSSSIPLSDNDLFDSDGPSAALEFLPCKQISK